MPWDEIPEINLYSDGGAEPNPGKGGFGVILEYKGRRKEFSDGFRLTTNNRMELMGVIYGLEQLKTKSIVHVYSDSRYVVDGITEGWAMKWKSKNWYRTKSKKAINWDLWARLLDLISIQERVTFNWIKGHFGHPENERCDELANLALTGAHLNEDIGYEEDIFKKSGFEFTPMFQTFETDRIEPSYTNGKVKKEGDPCRKCGSSVVQKSTKKKEFKPSQTYFYEYYFICPSCKTFYMVDEAKRFI